MKNKYPLHFKILSGRVGQKGHAPGPLSDYGASSQRVHQPCIVDSSCTSAIDGENEKRKRGKNALQIMTHE